jgi:hypothetical protein
MNSLSLEEWQVLHDLMWFIPETNGEVVFPKGVREKMLARELIDDRGELTELGKHCHAQRSLWVTEDDDMTDSIQQDLVEIARAVVLMNKYEMEARSGDQLRLLEETADKAREVLASLGEENTDG